VRGQRAFKGRGKAGRQPGKAGEENEETMMGKERRQKGKGGFTEGTTAGPASSKACCTILLL